MLLTVNADLARAFSTNYPLYQSFILSIDLANGATVRDRKHAIEDLAAAARYHHERLHHANL